MKRTKSFESNCQEDIRENYINTHSRMPSGKENQSSSSQIIISNEPEAELQRKLLVPRGIHMSNNDCVSNESPDESECLNPEMPSRTENQSSRSQNIISNKPKAEYRRKLPPRPSSIYVLSSEIKEPYSEISEWMIYPPTHTSGWIYRHQVQLLIFIGAAIIIMLPMAPLIIVNYTEIAELKQLKSVMLERSTENYLKHEKSVMLYRPTETYLTHEKRPEAVEWRLVGEHSQNPFTQFNTTHLRVKEDGVYAISCTMLIEIDIHRKNPSSITLLIYAMEDKPIYTKKYLSNIFSIQQSIVLKLHQGDAIFVEIHPSKLLSKASDASHLSIVQL